MILTKCLMNDLLGGGAGFLGKGVEEVVKAGVPLVIFRGSGKEDGGMGVGVVFGFFGHPDGVGAGFSAPGSPVQAFEKFFEKGWGEKCETFEVSVIDGFFPGRFAMDFIHGNGAASHPRLYQSKTPRLKA